MNVLNRDDVQEALYESGRNWNIDAIIDEAEYHAMINGEFDEDFTYEDRDTEYRFECLKPTTYIYDEEGELVQGMDDEEYWLEWIQDKKTGRDIYRKSSPQYEEMFKGTRKASANKAQGVKADEKKEVFVYKAMDVNGNGVFKVFYDDGTYEILKGGRAYERSWGDYDKFVSMETLRHATAPPKGKARKASARGVKADSQKHKMRLYNDLTVEQLEKEKARQEKYLKYYLAQPDRWKVEEYIKQCYKIINACNMAIRTLNDADTEMREETDFDNRQDSMIDGSVEGSVRRRAIARKVRAAQDGWTYYEDLTHEEQEIYLYAENDGRLYESKTKPIMRNMARKINDGTYDKDKAVVAWEYLVKDAIAKYNKEFDDEQIRLNPASRKRVAQVLADSYEDEVNDMAKEMKSGRKSANRVAQVDDYSYLFSDWRMSDYVEEGDTIYSDGQDYYITEIKNVKTVDGYELAVVEVSTGANIGVNVPKKLVGNQDYYYFVLLNGDVEWGVCDTYEEAKEWYDGVEDGYYEEDYGYDETDAEDVESSVRRKSGARRAAKKPVNADLKIISDLSDYQPWSGAVETYERIKDAGKLDAFEAEMELIYPEGLTMTELNDILWFEPEWVYELLGMDNDEEYDEYED